MVLAATRIVERLGSQELGPISVCTLRPWMLFGLNLHWNLARNPLDVLASFLCHPLRQLYPVISPTPYPGVRGKMVQAVPVESQRVLLPLEPS